MLFLRGSLSVNLIILILGIKRIHYLLDLEMGTINQQFNNKTSRDHQEFNLEGVEEALYQINQITK